LRSRVLRSASPVFYQICIGVGSKVVEGHIILRRAAMPGQVEFILDTSTNFNFKLFWFEDFQGSATARCS